MKKKYILLLLLGFFGMNISAQTLTQAKALYEKGQYDQAKPAFKKFVKSQPNNGSYNLWYGVCCLNTGEAEEAIKYLETAVKRRAAKRHRRLESSPQVHAAVLSGYTETRR